MQRHTHITSDPYIHPEHVYAIYMCKVSDSVTSYGEMVGTDIGIKLLSVMWCLTVSAFQDTSTAHVYSMMIAPVTELVSCAFSESLKLLCSHNSVVRIINLT